MEYVEPHVKALLFTAQGRINRGLFWKGALYLVAFAIVVSVVNYIIGLFIPSNPTSDGSYSVSGLAAVPFLILDFGFIVVSMWAGICLGIKRYHDRDKSGVWVLIQFVPFIGAIWYFIEAGCMQGTPGPNQYGADPLAVGYAV